MGTQKFIDARFLAPPLLVFFFIFLADPCFFYIRLVLTGDVLANLLGISILIFTFGYLLSTYGTAFYIIPNNLRTTLLVENKGKKVAMERFGLDPYSKTEMELATWLAVSKEEYQYVREQVDKRWIAFNANVNCLVALILALFIVLVFVRFPSYCWGLIWLAFFVVTFVAFNKSKKEALESVRQLDGALIKDPLNYKTTYENIPKENDVTPIKKN